MKFYHFTSYLYTLSNSVMGLLIGGVVVGWLLRWEVIYLKHGLKIDIRGIIDNNNGVCDRYNIRIHNKNSYIIRGGGGVIVLSGIHSAVYLSHKYIYDLLQLQ